MAINWAKCKPQSTPYALCTAVNEQGQASQAFKQSDTYSSSFSGYKASPQRVESSQIADHQLWSIKNQCKEVKE